MERNHWRLSEPVQKGSFEQNSGSLLIDEKCWCGQTMA
jgi:hypothetical protein